MQNLSQTQNLSLCVYSPNVLTTPMPKTPIIPISARLLATIAFLVLFAGSAGAADTYTESPGTEGDGKVTIGPEYKIDPDLTDRGNPKGKSFEFTMRLAVSKIFPGDDKTLDPAKKPVREKRKITVYVPAAYKDGTK